MPPETRYAQVGRDRLAYQILGQGPPDLVFTMGSFSHVDMVWDDPQVALFLRRLASFSRLLRFDRRGTGASDPLPPDPLPAWEAYTEELGAVMDAVGSRRARCWRMDRRPARWRCFRRNPAGTDQRTDPG